MPSETPSPGGGMDLGQGRGDILEYRNASHAIMRHVVLGASYETDASSTALGAQARECNINELGLYGFIFGSK